MVSKSIKHVIPEGTLQSEDPHLPTSVKKNPGKVFYDGDTWMREQIWWSAEKKIDLQPVTRNVIKFLKTTWGNIYIHHLCS